MVGSQNKTEEVAMHYGQFCPVAKASEMIAERWTPLVIAELLAGSTRFNDIRRGVPLMSQTLLSTRPKELERVGIRRMIAVWFGKLAWEAGVRSGRVEVIGPRQLRERLGAWFLLSSIRANNDEAGQHATTTRAVAKPVAVG
jgi:hypothetical protein